MKIRDKIYCIKDFNLGQKNELFPWTKNFPNTFSAGREYTILDIIELFDYSQSLAYKGAYIAGDTKNYLYFCYSDDCKFTNDKQLSGVKFLTDYPCFDDYFVHKKREKKLKLIKLNEI